MLDLISFNVSCLITHTLTQARSKYLFLVILIISDPLGDSFQYEVVIQVSGHTRSTWFKLLAQFNIVLVSLLL